MLKLLKRLRGREWALIALSFVLVVAQVWLELTMPDYMSEMTRLTQMEGAGAARILAPGFKMLLCALGALAASVMISVAAGKVAADFSFHLREDVYTAVSAFSMGEISRFSTAGLITRSTNDVTQVQTALAMGLQVLMRAPVMGLWAVGKIAGKSGAWTASTAVTVAVLMLLVGVSVALTMPRFRKMQRLTDDLNRVAREGLTGVRDVRAYNAEGYQEKKFDAVNEKFNKNQLAAQRVMAFMMPGIQASASGLQLAIYWVGAFLISAAALGDRVSLFADMVVFSAYAMQVVMAFMLLVMLTMLLPRASVSAQRINEVVQTVPAVRSGDRTEGKHGLRGDIVFENVSFKYPDAEEAAVEHVSFRVREGETLAIIGATGSGKSSVINLIPRFYDATEGRVLVDGVDVRDYALPALRGKIGYVSQRAVLFGGTVMENVMLGKPEDAGLAARAVHTAQADEFVRSLPGGMDARVAPGGGNLSGGQKQRLSIARALAGKPEIMIFDDSFSALDYRTDRALREALENTGDRVTRVIVAQRIGTIRHADKIIVVEKGRVAGMGTHEELMAASDVYREIAGSQMSREEMEK